MIIINERLVESAPVIPGLLKSLQQLVAAWCFNSFPYSQVAMMSCKLSLVSLLVGSAVAQNPNATWATCCGPADAQCIQWTTFVISPIAPNPGDTLYVNATGVVPSPVLNSSLSVGTVNAFLYGVDVFSAPITTCGETQVCVRDHAGGVGCLLLP